MINKLRIHVRTEESKTNFESGQYVLSVATLTCNFWMQSSTEWISCNRSVSFWIIVAKSEIPLALSSTLDWLLVICSVFKSPLMCWRQVGQSSLFWKNSISFFNFEILINCSTTEQNPCLLHPQYRWITPRARPGVFLCGGFATCRHLFSMVKLLLRVWR